MKLIRRYLLLLVVLWASFSATAQSFKKVYKTYQRGLYQQAQTGFLRYEMHPKHSIAAQYYLLSLKVRKAQQLPIALQVNQDLCMLAVCYDELSAKRKAQLYKRYAVDTVGISELRHQTQVQAIVDVRVRATLTALDSLLKLLEKPLPDVEALIQETHTDIVHAHLDSEDYDVLTHLLKDHWMAVQPSQFDRSRRVYGRLWSTFLAKYPVCALQRFADDHPTSFVARDCWRTPVRQALCASGLDSLLWAWEKYPSTALESVLFTEIRRRAADSLQMIALTAAQRRQLDDIRALGRLNGLLDRGIRRADSTAVRQRIEAYVQAYAPRFSAFRLLENALQALLEQELYTTAATMLQAAQPYFLDTLSKTCKSSFLFQRRVRPWIRGKLPILQHPREGLTATPLVALNTEAGDEANPVLTADGQALYFSGAGRSDNYAPGPDVYVAQRTDTGWAAPVLVPAFANRDATIPLSITADGKQMLLQVNGHLALSQRHNSIWQTPQPLRIDGLARVWRGFLSADGRVLVVEGTFSAGTVSEPPDVDLFVYLRDSTGVWGKPIALGAHINTDEHEGYPYLAADNRTLYFTTTGYPGLGDSDVFMSTRIGNNWTSWTRPANMGKEINDTFNHHGVGDVRAGRAIFAKYLRGAPKGDLWETTLPKSWPPLPSLGQ